MNAFEFLLRIIKSIQVDTGKSEEDTDENATKSDEDSKKKIDLEEAKKNATKIIQNVRMNFFPEKTTPTDDQLRMVIGQIINLYRDPMDRLAEYEVAKDITVSCEYPTNKEESIKEENCDEKKINITKP